MKIKIRVRIVILIVLHVLALLIIIAKAVKVQHFLTFFQINVFLFVLINILNHNQIISANNVILIVLNVKFQRKIIA